jgi:type II secretory pathway predicted ATPase ExeA
MAVIPDEAGCLKADALEFSRRLVNDLGKSGLALIGLPRLTGAIQNLRNDRRQLESRIGVYLPLAGLTRKDAGTVCMA